MFFIGTFSNQQDLNIEKTEIYRNIRNFICNNFPEQKSQLLIYQGNEIYNIIRINQKKDKEHETVFGVDTLIDKILHFFLYDKINSLLNNNLNNNQDFFQQRNILQTNPNCMSDLSRNCKNFSIHELLFRKFLTLADVSNYFYAKSIGLVTAAHFICNGSCLIPIPFVDLPLYYSTHFAMVVGILSVFGIKLNEVNIKTILLTNGTNLGGNYSGSKTIQQIIHIGIKIVLSIGKIASDTALFIPILGYAGRGTDILFSNIDTFVFGKNLINTCNKLPKNQQFFKNELEKFYYILNKINKIKSRINGNN